ncbi:MAG: SDR family oxidoreductase [Gallionella sp.]
MANFLITGANGFVGRALCADLVQHGYTVRAAVRSDKAWMEGLDNAVVGELNAYTDWAAALNNIEVVIHVAARVHVMQDTSTDPLAEFRHVNVDATEHLARQAVLAGVKRLVYVSSIKVNGEGTSGITSYTEQDIPNPQDPYGVSKWEAEQALQRVAAETGLEVVIVRPPLIYGAGVKGNFISLFSVIERGVPLPLAGAQNARNLVYVGNFVDALRVCATHPDAAGQTYLVSDGEAISTAQLVANIATALGCRNPAFYFPVGLLRRIGGALGRTAAIDRLFGSLRINDQKIRNELAWQPPYTMAQGLCETADWYHSTHPSSKS